MVGSATADPDRAAVPERDQILTTKVKIPRVRPGYLNRSRLIDALDEAITRELILVCTPAGFGKTTLLADWAEGADVAVAWLSLDEDDNDPTRFWRYVLVALDRVIDVNERVLSLATDPGGTSSTGLRTALGRELEELPEDLVLVLDDYHLIDSGDIHNGLEFLLRHQPPRLHVLVSTRADPPLPIARLRARHQLAEFRAADLRFTAQETAAFLENVWGLDVRPPTVATLQARTEGWAVGLQLAALSLQDRVDKDAFLEEFTGTHRYVLDYLSEEVFEAQPEPLKEFLLQTSILERLSGPLCDAVTGRTDGQVMIEELDRANLFVIPLDEERRWYRFHHLFADLLRVRLQQTAPASLPELHRRAGSWCARHGLMDDGIRHALSSGDSMWAAELVEGNLNDAFVRGEGATVVRWLSLLPERLVQSRPRLCIARAMMEWHGYRLEEMERALHHVETALEDRDDPGTGEVPTEGGMVSDVRAAISLLWGQIDLVRAKTESGRKHVNAAISRLTEEETGPRFFARWLLLSSDWICGRMEHVEAKYTEMLTEGRAKRDAHPLMTSCTPLGCVQEARGRLSAALRTYDESLRFATEVGRFSSFHAAEAHLGIARVLCQRNQLDEALRHCNEGVDLARQGVENLLVGIGLQTLAWIRHAKGNPEAASEAMEETVNLIPSPNVGSWFYPGLAGHANLLLAHGDLEEAERWTQQRRLGTRDEVSYALENDYLVLVRVLLAKSDHAEALELLGRLEHLADSQSRGGSLIEIRALRALALDATGDRHAATALLAETISLARPEGYVRVFVHEGPPMARLLRALAATGQEVGPRMSRPDRAYRNQILRAFEPVDSPADGELRVAGAPHPLTDRELEVLGLIAAGRRNQEIAADLWVSLDTVKKHVSHILDKLAVTNRTEAVAEGRRLGLIGNDD